MQFYASWDWEGGWEKWYGMIWNDMARMWNAMDGCWLAARAA